ncbi:MAG: hypothetical protein ACXIUQ_11365 [Cecembia sp.]
MANLPGWRTDRKLVVFQSDDWGSVRMPSQKVYKILLERGIPVSNLAYQRFDNLATGEDFETLFSVLTSFKDINGNHPVITANTILTNPDFKKIKETEFSEYHYELFTDTLKRYGGDFLGAFDQWKTGIQLGVFYPQFHGREHLNIKRWMKALKNNVGNVRFAFDHGVFDLSTNNVIHKESFMDALDISNEEDLKNQESYLKEGLSLFEDLFGFRSKTFTAPCYVWHPKLEKSLYENGVLGLQGGWVQKIPVDSDKIQYQKKRHYTGKKNRWGQIYLVRNAEFEPSQEPSIDWIGDVLNRADISFLMKKPLIISTHRLNFIGSLDIENRNKNLKLLKQLLKKLQERHPELEFLHSAELVDQILV